MEVETADQPMMMDRSHRGNSAASSYVRAFFSKLDGVRRAQRDTRYAIAMGRGDLDQRRRTLATLQEEERSLLRHIGHSKFAKSILRDGPPEARDPLKKLFDEHEARCQRLRDLQAEIRKHR